MQVDGIRITTTKNTTQHLSIAAQLQRHDFEH